MSHVTIDGIELPSCDTNDPAQIEAWFGNYGLWENYRKVVLSSCRELVRAETTLDGKKLSEARIDDLARIHVNYLEFLADGLHGRHLREQNVRASVSR